MDNLKDRTSLQRYLHRLESWMITSCMKFNKSKYQIFYLHWVYPDYTYKLGDKTLEKEILRFSWGAPSTS